jgi:acyl-lipid (7-3)-desaturase (Delta-4 desaturase)
VRLFTKYCLLEPLLLRYKFDTEFEREIKREVFKIVRRGREFGTWGWYARCAFYVSFFSYLQYLWVTQGSSWGLAILYGVAQAFIGLNVQHDANHGAASKNHRINDILGLGADFIGGSRWLWLEQHWTVSDCI